MTPVGEGTGKGVTPVSYEEQLNAIRTVGEEKGRIRDTVFTEKGSVELSDQSETCPSLPNRKYPVTPSKSSKPTFVFCFRSSESVLGLNICLYSTCSVKRKKIVTAETKQKTWSPPIKGFTRQSARRKGPVCAVHPQSRILHIWSL